MRRGLNAKQLQETTSLRPSLAHAESCLRPHTLRALRQSILAITGPRFPSTGNRRRQPRRDRPASTSVAGMKRRAAPRRWETRSGMSRRLAFWSVSHRRSPSCGGTWGPGGLSGHHREPVLHRIRGHRLRMRHRRVAPVVRYRHRSSPYGLCDCWRRGLLCPRDHGGVDAARAHRQPTCGGTGVVAFAAASHR